jgi:hypothetical protein
VTCTDDKAGALTLSSTTLAANGGSATYSGNRAGGQPSTDTVMYRHGRHQRDHGHRLGLGHLRVPQVTAICRTPGWGTACEGTDNLGLGDACEARPCPEHHAQVLRRQW